MGNPTFAGNLYQDESGALYVDPAGVEVGDVESGAMQIGGGQRRLQHLHNRISRLQGREQQLNQSMGHEQAGPTVYNADLRALAAQKGLIVENQFDGLGSVTLAPAAVNNLSDNLNRDCWIKGMIISASNSAAVGDGLNDIAITSITVAGVPINIGSKSMPAQTFARDSVRFGISFGRRLVRSGQAVTVNLANLSGALTNIVQGGLICDEMASYLVQGVAEAGLLSAVNGSGVGSY